VRLVCALLALHGAAGALQGGPWPAWVKQMDTLYILLHSGQPRDIHCTSVQLPVVSSVGMRIKCCRWVQPCQTASEPDATSHHMVHVLKATVHTAPSEAIPGGMLQSLPTAATSPH